MKLHPGKRKKAVGTSFGMTELFEQAIYIPAKGKSVVHIIVPSIIFETQELYQFTLSIDFCNVFDYCTSATIYMEDLENQTQENKYKFRLAKFTDIHPKAE